MLTILFAPWKTGSTRLLKSLEGRGYTTIKELFHEDRYEAKGPPSNAVGLNPDLSDIPLAPIKFRRDFEDLPEDAEKILEAVLDRCCRAVPASSNLVVQIAESFDLAFALYRVASTLNPSTRLVCSQYDRTNQACAIFHNYLEGNSYFAANAFLIAAQLVLPDTALGRLGTALERMSCTGRILAASRILATLPRTAVLSTLSLYLKALARQSARSVADPEFGQDRGVVDLLRDRYRFISGEVRHYLCQNDSAHVLEESLTHFQLGRAFVASLQVERRLLPVWLFEGGVVFGLLMDRAFTANLGVSDCGNMIPLNDADLVSVSGNVLYPIQMKYLVVSGGEDLRDLLVMVDGLPVNALEETSPATPVSESRFGQARWYRLERLCTTDVYVELRCLLFPRVEFVGVPVRSATVYKSY